MRWLTRTLARSGYSSPCTCSHSDLTCLAEDCGSSTVTVATDPSAPMISTGSTVRVVMGWARSASVRRIEPASAQSMHMEHNLPRLLENTCMHFYRQDSKFHERARPKYGRDISLRLDFAYLLLQDGSASRQAQFFSLSTIAEIAAGLFGFAGDAVLMAAPMGQRLMQHR